MKDSGALSKEQLRQLLLQVLNGLACDLGLPATARDEGADREAEGGETV